MKPVTGEIANDALLNERPAAAATKPAAQTIGRWRVYRGLLWAEWFAHSKLLLSFIGLWLVCVWGLPLLANPGWILLLGVVFALLAGPIYGGQDVVQGCEEFSFALPATRSERYLARLIVGGGTLLFFTVLDILVLGIDLPQILARVYVTTGLAKPMPVFKPHLLYGLVPALPFAIFSFAFAVSAASHSRTLIFTAWLWSSVVALAALQIGLWGEELRWREMNGFLTCPLLAVLGAGALWAGGAAYRRKEVSPHATPFAIPGRWWAWILLLLIGLALALALIFSLAREYPKFFTAA